MPASHLLIKGKVQGVFYRASAKQAAESLSIKGWVKNTTDGHVEIMATAAAAQLSAFVEWCRKGPGGATVIEVIETIVEEILFDGFSIKY